MKEKTVHHKLQIHEDRQPKYIHNLIQKAEERQREHDVIYERKPPKERNKEEHLRTNLLQVLTRRNLKSGKNGRHNNACVIFLMRKRVSV